MIFNVSDTLPVGVLPHGLGEVVEDVGDPLLDDVGGLGLGDGAVEEDEELAQGGLVHHVHLAQLHDQEVEDAPTCRHRPDNNIIYLNISLKRKFHLSKFMVHQGST